MQGLAWASDCPVVPVSSLAATAQSVVSDGVGSALVALDARMNEVFTGMFEANSDGIMIPVREESVCAPAEVSAPVHTKTYGVGIGFERYPELRDLAGGLQGILADTWPRAFCVLQLAKAWLATHEALPAERAQPVYLRDNVAKKPQA